MSLESGVWSVLCQSSSTSTASLLHAVRIETDEVQDSDGGPSGNANGAANNAASEAAESRLATACKKVKVVPEAQPIRRRGKRNGKERSLFIVPRPNNPFPLLFYVHHVPLWVKLDEHASH